MAFTSEVLQERIKRSESLFSELEQRGVRFAQLEMPEINGPVRGKIGPLKKALSPSGSGISTLIVAGRSRDELCDTPFTSLANGYPKMVALPDYDTVREMPWKPGMASILYEFFMDDGEPCALDPRHLLKKAIAKSSQLQLEARAAIEFECYVFHRDDDLLKAGRFQDLVPFGRNRDFYSLTKTPSFDGLATEFIGRMADIGIEIEAFHSEYGYGMFEFIMGVAPILDAADAATRAKLHFKQLCTERGLIAVFMPLMGINPEDNACGAHHNISLWRDGKNAFWDAEHEGLSAIGEQFAAGLLETAPAFHALFKPWVNSYRRMDRFAFSPENASWGLDNHSVALRIAHGFAPEKQTRLEHRLAATDTNFYLTFAAILLGGLHGIEQKATPPPLAEGDASLSDAYPPLSANLSESINALRESSLARDLLGKDLIEHFSAIREEEWKDYASWCQSKDIDPTAKDVTDWERWHYFEWV